MERVKLSSVTDIEEIEKNPIEDQLDSLNTYDMIQKGAMLNPESTAISFFPTGDQYDKPLQIPYRTLIARITQTANLFHDLGLGPKDVVSYLLPNLPQTHFILWGGQANCVVNPINPLLEPVAIREICHSAGTKMLVVLGEFPGTNIWEKAISIRSELPDLKAIIRVGGPSDEKEGIYGYDEIIDSCNSDNLDSKRTIDPQDVATIFHTGGTTGTPKLAPRTHFNEVVMPHMLLPALELNQGEAILCGLPLFHANGTTVTGSTPFSIGAHVVLLGTSGYRDPYVVQNFFKIVEYYKAVTFSAVPTFLSVLLEIPKGDADISSLRFAGCGAAPLSVELFKRFEEYSDMKILEGYGLTEGTCVSAINPSHGKPKVGSIGYRLPYQEMKVFILDDKGIFVREAETDEIGTICIKGPNIFKGYVDEDHNQGIWAKPGWFNTGDLGRQDADGFFWLTGRTKELIIRSGHNIDPAAIEDPLYRLPGIQMAAAVGRPDPYAGEVPVAFVQVQEGTGLNPEQILEYLNQEIGERAAIPKAVAIIDQMPLTPVGKIFKPALRWTAIKEVYETELRSLGNLAESVDVEVGEDKVHGSLALISIKSAPEISHSQIEARVDEILALYTIRYRLQFA
jgi:fatty-acyl-CoA synthase